MPHFLTRLSKQKLSAKKNCALKQLSLEAKYNLKELRLTDSIFEETIEVCINADFLIPAHIVRIHKAKVYLQDNMPQKALNHLLKYFVDVLNSRYVNSKLPHKIQILSKFLLKIEILEKC